MFTALKSLVSKNNKAKPKSTLTLGVDPRTLSSEKLKAPFPLPYISRKSLKRVAHRMPIPECCNCCGEKSVHLTSNSEIYGREFGEWPYAYLCSSCDAYVGVHKHTDLPLGTLADKSTREARKSCKFSFLLLQDANYKNSRSELYEWLAKQLDIPFEECHWACFDEAQCLKAKDICILACEEL